MSLETHISGSEDRLIDGLHFGSRNTASYIVERTQATFHPTSASAWQPSGVRLLRFNLADVSGWLDPGTVRLCFSLNNLDQDAAVLAPVLARLHPTQRAAVPAAVAVLEALLAAAADESTATRQEA